MRSADLHRSGDYPDRVRSRVMNADLEVRAPMEAGGGEARSHTRYFGLFVRKEVNPE